MGKLKAFFDSHKENLKKILWVVLFALFFLYIFSQLDSGFSAVNIHLIPWSIKIPGFILAGIVGIGFVVFLEDALSKYKMRSQPSWVYYTFWGLITSISAHIIFQIFDLSKKQLLILLWNNTKNNEVLLRFYHANIWYIVALITLTSIYILTKKNDTKKFTSFAPGSVGIIGDKFEFAQAASNFAEGIKLGEEYVSVVGIYGGMGFGKSSFSRMIVENFDKEKTLYTYISLTETNEAKDFSKLFAERWSSTLSERYPKIDIPNYLPIVNTILRENGQSALSSIIQAITGLNFGLLKTVSKAKDPDYISDDGFVSKGIAATFGNIPRIYEDQWIILIDEIERAQLDEIYRLIEIIERFKIEGITGFPIKVTFFLCISQEDLDKLVETFKTQDVRAFQISNFCKDAKSITRRVFIPPVKPVVMDKFVLEKTYRLKKEKGLDVPDGIHPNTIKDPTTSFIDEKKESFDYVLGMLTDVSPRLIDRVFNALDFFLESFRDKSKTPQGNLYRASDFLVMEYIKINYPSLVEFFKKTLVYLVVAEEQNNINNWLLHHEFEKDKTDLLGWISKVLERELTSEEKNIFPKLIGLVAHSYFDFMNKDSSGSRASNKISYEGTLSYPENLYDYLSAVAGSTETTFKRYNEIYKKHQQSSDVLNSLSALEIAQYARFLSNIRSQITNRDFHVDVLKVLTEKITDHDIRLDYGNIGDTAYDEIIYRFAFSMLDALEEDFWDIVSIEKNIPIVFECLKKVLLSEKVTVGGKLIILNSLANSQRAGHSSIQMRLHSIFEKLENFNKSGLLDLIKHVFDDFKKRYVVEQKVIYENEENFFYTMYQTWSGSKDNDSEIKELRTIARNGLEKHEKFLKVYWDRYPYNPQFTTIEDVFKRDHFNNDNYRTTNLYMPLETLIEITDKANVQDPEILQKLALWRQDSFVNNPKYIELAKIQDDNQPLRAVLIRDGYLPKVENTDKPDTFRHGHENKNLDTSASD